MHQHRAAVTAFLASTPEPSALLSKRWDGPSKRRSETLGFGLHEAQTKVRGRKDGGVRSLGRTCLLHRDP